MPRPESGSDLLASLGPNRVCWFDADRPMFCLYGRQWRRSVAKYRSGSVRSSHQTVFFHPWWRELAELSNNMFWMKECDIVRGSKHTLTPPTHFQWSRPPTLPGSTPWWPLYLLYAHRSAVDTWASSAVTPDGLSTAQRQCWFTREVTISSVR